ncbi:MAG: O-acetylhomoserine aminocarboxypropyltransferase [Dongiaceae bacterium]
MNDKPRKPRTTPSPAPAAEADAPAPARRDWRANPGFETRAIHAGTPPDPTTGARITPIYQTIAYVFDDADHAASLFDLSTFGYIYSRLTNPTVAALEEKVASLENARGATACASGHAAQILAFFSFMEAGDQFLASKKLYGGSVTQFDKTFKKFGWEVIFVDPDDPRNFARALTPKCKAIFVESPANPSGTIVDIEPIAETARKAGIPLIVDSTLATPFLCQPIAWGADIVIHSMTKFLGGHGNSMGGVVVDSGKFDWGQNDKFKGLTAPEPAYHGLRFYETFGDMAMVMHMKAVGLRDLGPTLAPMNAFQILTGIETLALRMQRHCDNALAVAAFLEGHPQVGWVSYAGLESSRYNALARKYLGGRGGSLFTFGVKGGYEAGMKVVESCELLSHLANIGDTRSLILHPASTTHRQLTDHQRVAAGAGPDVVRLSIGLETVEDIISDLDQALAAAARG